MMLAGMGRVWLLVPLLLLLNVGPVAAHALPGSILTFSRTNDHLSLSINIPVEDLVLANPALSPLEQLPINDKISAPLKTHIADYFELHTRLSTNSHSLPLTVIEAVLASAANEDVGTYKLLSLTLSTPAQTTAVEQLVLRYDAVMHEVRNHRAMVYWRKPGNDTIRLATFGFSVVDSQPKPIYLNIP